MYVCFRRDEVAVLLATDRRAALRVTETVLMTCKDMYELENQVGE